MWTCDIKAIGVKCSEINDVVVIRVFSLGRYLAVSHLARLQRWSGEANLMLSTFASGDDFFFTSNPSTSWTQNVQYGEFLKNQFSKRRSLEKLLWQFHIRNLTLHIALQIYSTNRNKKQSNSTTHFIIMQPPWALNFNQSWSVLSPHQITNAWQAPPRKHQHQLN